MHAARKCSGRDDPGSKNSHRKYFAVAVLTTSTEYPHGGPSLVDRLPRLGFLEVRTYMEICEFPRNSVTASVSEGSLKVNSACST